MPRRMKKRLRPREAIMNARRLGTAVVALAVLLSGAARIAQADVITDWNDKACKIVAGMGPGAPGHRLMAIVQVSVFEAVNSIEPRYTPYMQKVAAPAGASVAAGGAGAPIAPASPRSSPRESPSPGAFPIGPVARFRRTRQNRGGAGASE